MEKPKPTLETEKTPQETEAAAVEKDISQQFDYMKQLQIKKAEYMWKMNIEMAVAELQLEQMKLGRELSKEEQESLEKDIKEIEYKILEIKKSNLKEALSLIQEIQSPELEDLVKAITKVDPHFDVTSTIDRQRLEVAVRQIKDENIAVEDTEKIALLFQVGQKRESTPA